MNPCSEARGPSRGGCGCTAVMEREMGRGEQEGRLAGPAPRAQGPESVLILCVHLPCKTIHASRAAWDPTCSSVQPALRGDTDWNRLPWPGKIGATCMSYLNNRSGTRGKEYGTNKLPQTRIIQEGSRKEEMSIHMFYQPARILLAEIHLG